MIIELPDTPYGSGYQGNGGDGWLRILEFMPGKTIKVRTYFPLFGISPTTKHLAHRRDPYDQFDILHKIIDSTFLCVCAGQ